MFDAPKTIEEAQAYRYNRWAGNPSGYKYRDDQCAYEVCRLHLYYQCDKKNGKGPSGLYCGIHAKKVKP